MQGLIDVALLRNTAAALGIREIREQQNSLLLYPERFSMELGMQLSAAPSLKGRVLISAGGKPYYAVRIDRTGGKDGLDTLREVLEAARPADAAQGKEK